MVANANNDHNVDVFGKLARGVLHQLALQKYTTCIIMGGTNDLSAGRNAGCSFVLHVACVWLAPFHRGGVAVTPKQENVVCWGTREFSWQSCRHRLQKGCDHFDRAFLCTRK